MSMQDELYIYNLKLEILQSILERYRDEHERLNQQWRDIENKAQGTINISGVLITLSGLFVQRINSNFPPDMKLVLALAVISLFLILCSAITVLLVKKNFYTPTVTDWRRMVEEICICPDEELALRRLNLIRDRCDTWEGTAWANKKASSLKAASLFAAQCLLIVSLFMVTMIVVRSTFWGARLMSNTSDLNNRKLTCNVSDCKKTALPNSNYCKDHTRGGNGKGSDGKDIARAVEYGIVERVERVTEQERTRMPDIR